MVTAEPGDVKGRLKKRGVELPFKCHADPQHRLLAKKGEELEKLFDAMKCVE